MKKILLLSILLTSCQVPGYKMEPSTFSVRSPDWLGGPIMTWKFVPDEVKEEE